MTVQVQTHDISSEMSWMSPARGLWVATHEGEHAGMVERLDGVYHARNARGHDLGSFEDLDGARDVVDGGEENLASDVRSVTTLLWAVNVVAAVMAVSLAFALLR